MPGRIRRAVEGMEMDEKPLVTVGLVNSRVIPPIMTDPFNPPKIKVGLEIDSGQLQFISLSSLRKGKALGAELFSALDHFTVTEVSAVSRVSEIFLMSLIRGAAWVILFYLFFVLFRSYSLGFGILMAGVVGLFAAGFYFLLNGGLTSWKAVVRFRFVRKEKNGKFQFDVEPSYAEELRVKILSSGLRLVQPGGDA